MIPVVSVLVVLAISIVVVRVAAVGITLTGVSKDLAELQALSAFTGTGFTTEESEEIVNHPVRRRIVMHLMLLGNVGIVLAISSLLLSFLNSQQDGEPTHLGVRLLVLLVGIVVLSVISTSSYIEQLMWKVNTWALQRWGRLHVLDYTKLLRLSHNYVVYELTVGADDWLAGQSLAQLQLASEGVLVLGVERADGDYVGAPRGSTHIYPGDSIIVYGRQETLNELDDRTAGMVGNLRHVMAVTRQLDVLEDEDRGRVQMPDDHSERKS